MKRALVIIVAAMLIFLPVGVIAQETADAPNLVQPTDDAAPQLEAPLAGGGEGAEPALKAKSSDGDGGASTENEEGSDGDEQIGMAGTNISDPDKPIERNKIDEPTVIQYQSGRPNYDDPLMTYGKKIIVSAAARNLLFVVMIIFVIILFIPLVPGIKEIYRPQDAKPLPINLSYDYDARFFDKSFSAMLKKALGIAPLPGMHEIQLSKKENVEVFSGSKHFPSQTGKEHLLFVEGDFTSENGAHFDKEVYVEGNAYVGGENYLRGLAAGGDIEMKSGSTLVRWMGAPGDITVRQNCLLGWRVACEGKMKLEHGCAFRRLCSPQIDTGNGARSAVRQTKGGAINGAITHSPVIDPASDAGKKQKDGKKKKRRERTRGRLVISPHTHVEEDIESKRRSIVVGSNAVVRGDISTRGKLKLQRNVIVDGDIYAEKDVIVEDGCIIMGDIFCHGEVRLGRDVEIGCSYNRNSIICRKKLMIGEDNLIKGSLKGYEDIIIGSDSLIEGSIFSEENITVGAGCRIMQNLFCQGEISIGTGVVVGRWGHTKSVIAKKGLRVSSDVTVYGVMQTEGIGVVT